MRAEGVVAVADEQTAGRGRLGRTWDAPPGFVAAGVGAAAPGAPAERLHLVTLAGRRSPLADAVARRRRVRRAG